MDSEFLLMLTLQQDPRFTLHDFSAVTRSALSFEMYESYRNLGHYLCCIPFRRNDSAASLSTLPAPASTVSVVFPLHSVPHGSSERVSENVRDLRQIFSSSSSIRGYQTAATTPSYQPVSRPSFDRDFTFGCSETTSKPQGRIEKLGNHIRQKFSQSRLSRASSKADVHAPGSAVQQTSASNPEKPEALLGTSQSTADLAYLLECCSNGGYDSDAKSIKTPLSRSNAGTVKISSGFVKQVLDNIGSDDTHLGNQPPVDIPIEQPEQGGATIQSPDDKPQSPQLPSTPSKISFTSALQIGANESPSDALRRLSVGLANGKIEAPTTPELKAMKQSSLDGVSEEWRLSAPRRSSSLKNGGVHTGQKMRHLSERLETAKKGDFASCEQQNDRMSLISELEPRLLNCMTRYAAQTSSKVASGEEQQPAPSVSQLNDDPAVDQKSLSPPDTGNPEHLPLTDRTSAEEVENDSVHLFDMRISQRLASCSQVPLLSPTNSVAISPESTAPPSAMASTTNVLIPEPSIPRYPTWISSEHNRRPSDPQTKRLFEAESSRRNLAYTWKTITSVDSGPASTGKSCANVLHPSNDDASSYYWSDGGESDGVMPCLPNCPRRRWLQNPHSLAIGERSVSGSFLSSTSGPNLTRPAFGREEGQGRDQPLGRPWTTESSCEESSRDRQRGRSASMPQDWRGPPASSPTPIMKRSRNRTITAEHLSEVSVHRILDRRNEAISEISIQELSDRRNERLSQVEHSRVAAQAHRFEQKDRFAEHRQQIRKSMSGGDSTKFPDSDDRSQRGIKECATVVWQRAFQQACDVQRYDARDNFLKAPLFDREGRRRSTRTEASGHDSNPRTRPRSISVGWSARAGSYDFSAPYPSSTELDSHHQSGATGKTPLPRTVHLLQLPDPIPDMHEIQATERASQGRKRSLFDLSVRYTHSRPTPDINIKSGFANTDRTWFRNWTRFPSYDRTDRNGTASLTDGVKSKDFASTPGRVSDGPQLSHIRTTPLLRPPETDLRPQRMFARLPWSINSRISKSKSMTLRSKQSKVLSPFINARKGRRHILGQWMRLYRSSSSESQQHTHKDGYRSSLSLGDAPLSPELECIRAESRLSEICTIKPRTDADEVNQESFEVIEGESTTKAVAKIEHSDAKCHTPDAEQRGQLYDDSVPTVPAPQPKVDSMSTSSMNSVAHTESGMKQAANTKLRRSTTDFQLQLGVEQEKTREELIEKAECIAKEGKVPCITEKHQVADAILNEELEVRDEGASIGTITPGSNLKIPGAFET